MSYPRRMSLLMGIDSLIICFSIWSSYYLRFSGNVPAKYVNQGIIFAPICIIVTFGFMYFFKLYNRVWQYASVGEIVSIFRAVVASTFISYLITGYVWNSVIPISVILRTFQTNLMLIGGIRFCWRIIRDNYYNKKKAQRRALIVGAGSCGTMIVKDLRHNRDSTIYPVGFIDDDSAKTNLQICGLPVLGSRHKIAELTAKHDIQEIIIAMPSVSGRIISEIIEICKETPAHLRIIPKMDEWINGQESFKQMRDVQVEDLLGRDAIKVDLDGIANYVENKTVLVTGAGGSIGSELCRQIAPFKPAKILLLGHGENSIYSIENEMRKKFPDVEIHPIIADVQHRSRMEEVFAQYRPQVVFHAAAHKHVPLMEKNLTEAIKNNVFGTKNVAECADLYQSERFVLISSDKAVNPTSIMGATKRIAEMLIQCLDQTSKTKFVAVRFGNVLGSRGSVIPRFKEQIAEGGPVTVTHPEMIRYFMTIPEAVQLVIQAGSFADGGEVFILDMGKPVKILDLATDLIKLSGYEPYDDIQIEFTGIRPGEKLYEELLLSEEGLTSTQHDRIFVGKPLSINNAELEFELKRLEKCTREDQQLVKDVVRHIVPNYQNVS